MILAAIPHGLEVGVTVIICMGAILAVICVGLQISVMGSPQYNDRTDNFRNPSSWYLLFVLILLAASFVYGTLSLISDLNDRAQEKRDQESAEVQESLESEVERQQQFYEQSGTYSPAPINGEVIVLLNPNGQIATLSLSLGKDDESVTYIATLVKDSPPLLSCNLTPASGYVCEGGRWKF